MKTFPPKNRKPTVKEKEEFEKLVKEWHKERGAASMAYKITNCDSYKKIFLMSTDVVITLVLEDVEKNITDPDNWFEALSLLTNMPPELIIPKEDRGDTEAMAKAWIKWARLNDYEW